ncbi:MAG: TetR family transcriptional regulator [Janthinobacterium lividum]
MARKKATEAEFTRQALIGAGLQVFSENGYSCSTLDMISQRAGVTRGAVYWHFKNKEALLQALLDSCVLPLETFLSAHTSLAVRLQDLDVAMEFTLGDPVTRQVCELLMHKSERVNGLDAISVRLQLAQRRFHQQIEEMLKDAVRGGDIAAQMDIASMAQVFRTCLTGLIFECLRESSGTRVKITSTLQAVTALLRLA